MAQAFETTYKRYHRKYDIEKRHPLPPVDRFAEALPESGNWLIIKSLEEQKESGLPLTEVENAVKSMTRKRLYTMYQLDYCSKDIPKEEYITDTAENELVRSADELYAVKDVPVLPTRPSARRVFGYLRPAYTLTPLTMYQLVHGQTAYKILKDGFPKDSKKDDIPKRDAESTEISVDQRIQQKTPSSGGYIMQESPGHHDLLAGTSSKTCSCKGKQDFESCHHYFT